MTQRNSKPRENQQIISQKKARPENKDNLDSRDNLEWQDKGDDVTHNRKEVHSQNRQKNKG